MPQSSGQVFALKGQHISDIERLLRTSEYIYQRFTPDELPMVLQHYPGVGLFNGPSLRGFLLSQLVNPPSAWLGGFGVSWTSSSSFRDVFSELLEHLILQLTHRRVRRLHYSGNDLDNDWLRPVLLTQGFAPLCQLFAYDKYEYHIPDHGNPSVIIRPVHLPKDIPALLAIEKACFEDLWRYDQTAFIDIASTHPYFVVAELDGRVVGYQFNAIDGGFGYLVRIAVLPEVNSRGIGTRLMAEAVQFFEREHVSRIMLNTQEENTHAHRLYEWFGFIRLNQKGFVLRKYL